jgi:hypothetical protein
VASIGPSNDPLEVGPEDQRAVIEILSGLGARWQQEPAVGGVRPEAPSDSLVSRVLWRVLARLWLTVRLCPRSSRRLDKICSYAVCGGIRGRLFRRDVVL